MIPRQDDQLRDDYDAIVVGAGPAGSSTAYHTARKGLRILIVDRLPFPRPKTCGDALSPRALRAVGRLGITNLPGHELKGFRVTDTRNRRSHVSAFDGIEPGETGMVVERTVLDTLLLAQAKKAGATFAVGRVGSLLEDRSGCVIGAEIHTKDTRKRITAATVVCAAGARGLPFLARRHPHKLQRGFAVACRVYVDVAEPTGDLAEIFLRLGRHTGLSAGYGWLFPVSHQRVNVGFGLGAARGLDPDALITTLYDLLAWLRDYNSAFRSSRVCGNPEIAVLPTQLRMLTEPGVLIVGDAAGVANPLTGEGIGNAIESGECAAESLAGGRRGVETRYEKALRKRLSRQARLNTRSRQLFQTAKLIVGRGNDTLVNPPGFVCCHLRRAVLDQIGDSDVESPNGRVPTIDAVVRLREEIVRRLEKPSALLEEIAREVVQDPTGGVGRFAGISQAVYCWSSGVECLSQDRWQAVAAMEMVELARRIQDDLVDDVPANWWGRNALSLAFADSVNAAALQLIYNLDSHWRHRISLAARDVMAFSANTSRTEASPNDLNMGHLHKWWMLSAAIGSIDGSVVGLPESVRAAAVYLGRSRAGQIELDTWESVRNRLATVADNEQYLASSLAALIEFFRPATDNASPAHGFLASAFPKWAGKTTH